MPLHTLTSDHAECASRIRWGDLAGREYGPRDAAGKTFVFLHGLTFDRLMWDPVIDALPAERHSIAFDLPGHGSSPMAPRPGLRSGRRGAPRRGARHGPRGAHHGRPLDRGTDRDDLRGHPPGRRRRQHRGTAATRAVRRAAALPPPAAERHRPSRRSGTASGRASGWICCPRSDAPFSVSDPRSSSCSTISPTCSTTPLAEVVSWRDDGLRRLRDQGTPYLALLANPVEASERAWLADHLPQAETVIWPVGHHFPQLDDPDRFAALLSGFAAGLG